MTEFPLLKMVGGAYREICVALLPLARIATLWLVAPVLLAHLGRVVVGRPPPAPVDGHVVISAEVLILGVAGWLVWLIGLNAIVVAWQRRLLLAERPRWPVAPVTGRVLRYVLMTLGLGLAVAVLVMLVMFVVATLLAGPGGEAMAFVSAPLMHVLIGVLGALAMARTHLVFPAIAIDDPSMSIGRSWRLTSGYTLRVVIGLIVCAVPVMLVGSILEVLLIAAGGAGTSLGLAIVTATHFVQGAVVATFLARSYRFFTTEVAGTRPGVTAA